MHDKEALQILYDELAARFSSLKDEHVRVNLFYSWRRQGELIDRDSCAGRDARNASG